MTVVTQGLEGMLPTAGPRQQQKTNSSLNAKHNRDTTTGEMLSTWKHKDHNRCQLQQGLSKKKKTTAPVLKNRRDASHIRDVNNMRDTENGRNTKKRKDVYNRKKQQNALQHHECEKQMRGQFHQGCKQQKHQQQCKD